MFADDSKIIGVIKNNGDLEHMQNDLDALVSWANEWRMMFHPDKCKSWTYAGSEKTAQN